ncbi:NAD-dependent epimerase/dehydratase family protein [Trinickia sp. LjRoot230]|uniref:NAD-dependent epimerase/dehydratase family protein n=1 Tax=Trinickia sp. LjRoot230 TaxID=3342288 RepID=UPI003F5041BF
MSEVVFLAGATGAIGTALVPRLIDAGYLVYGTTRKPALAPTIEAAGAKPVIVDVFDKETLEREMVRIKPAIVVHQLTDLPPALDPARMADAVPRNARIRDEGTRNLMSAASAAGCRHVVAQSISWAYAGGLSPTSKKPRSISMHKIRAALPCAVS